MMKNIPIRSFGGSLASLFVCALLAACGGYNGPLQAITVEQAHPIAVTAQATSLSLPVTPETILLSEKDKDAVDDFLREYRVRGHGRLNISAPSGGINNSAVISAMADIRAILSDSAIDPEDIGYGVYRVSAEARDAPILLSFSHYVALPSACGNFSRNLANESDNMVSDNFGCATQNNLAVALADPYDLIEPRAMTPADAARRAVILEKYRAGEITGAQRADNESGIISDVAR